MDLDLVLLATLGIFFVANFVQGFTGFGTGIVAMAGLSLIGGVMQATVLVNLGAVITVGAIFGRLWRHTSWRHLWPVVIGTIVCVPVGLMLLKVFGPTHPELVRRVLGVVIIGFSVWSLRGKTPEPREMRWPVGLAAGMMGGVLGGAFTMSGPPLVAYVYSLPLSRDALKASLNACFVLNCLYRLVLIISAGDVTRPVVIEFGCCVPAIGLGVIVGMVLARRVATDRFRRMAWVVFGLLGLILLVQ